MTFAVVGRPFHIPQGIARMWKRIVTDLPNKQARPALDHGCRLWRSGSSALFGLFCKTVEHVSFDLLKYRLRLCVLSHLHINPQVTMSDEDNLKDSAGLRDGNRRIEFPAPYVNWVIVV